MPLRGTMNDENLTAEMPGVVGAGFPGPLAQARAGKPAPTVAGSYFQSSDWFTDLPVTDLLIY
jgi:hypothetical protein